MIKRKPKPKVRKQRNPKESAAKIAKDILKHVDKYKYLAEGDEGETFYFRISKSINIGDFKLKPGEYVLKIFDRPISWEKLDYYNVLSSWKLIPTIYIKNSDFLIMKYIKATPLSYIIDVKNNTSLSYNQINQKINQLIKKWYKLGFAHGDLNHSNILIGKNKIYFIDPDMQDLEPMSEYKLKVDAGDLRSISILLKDKQKRSL